MPELRNVDLPVLRRRVATISPVDGDLVVDEWLRRPDEFAHAARAVWARALRILEKTENDANAYWAARIALGFEGLYRRLRSLIPNP